MRIGQTSVIHLIARVLMTLAGFLGNIYFARTLGAGPLGTYFLIVSVVMWFAIFAEAGVPDAVAKRISERGGGSNHISAGILIQVITILLVTVLVLSFRGQLSSYLGVDYVWILPVIIVLRVGLEYVQFVLRGQHKVHIESLMIPIDWVSRVTIQATLIYIGWSIGGLLVGYSASAVIAALFGVVYIKYRFTLPSVEDVRSVFDFSKYSWMSGVRGRTFHALDTIVLGAFVVPMFIGIYQIAWNVSSLFAIFGDSISRSMFPELSEAASKGMEERVVRYLNSSIAFSGMFAIPGLFGVLVVGDTVLSVYGQQFSQGKMVLLILTIANLFNVYESQLTNALNAIDRPDVTFKIQVVYIATNLVLNISLVYLYGWIGAAVATATAALLGVVLSYQFVKRLLPISLPFSEIGKQVIAASAMGLVTYALEPFVGESILSLAVIVPFGVIVYFGLLTVLSARFRDVVTSNIPNRVYRA